jgi:hypothetical protein
MRPIFGFSSSTARSRMPDALAPLLGASPESQPPGSPNLSPRVSGRALESRLLAQRSDPAPQLVLGLERLIDLLALAMPPFHGKVELRGL